MLLLEARWDYFAYTSGTKLVLQTNENQLVSKTCNDCLSSNNIQNMSRTHRNKFENKNTSACQRNKSHRNVNKRSTDMSASQATTCKMNTIWFSAKQIWLLECWQCLMFLKHFRNVCSCENLASKHKMPLHPWISQNEHPPEAKGRKPTTHANRPKMHIQQHV